MSETIELVREYNTEAYETKNRPDIISFPIDNIDTSWMTRGQRRFFELLKEPENRNKHYKELLKMAGYKNNDTWHRTIRDKRYADLLESMGVKTRLVREPYPAHNEVEYIKDPKEREDYLHRDEWDMRKLFEEYPRQVPPCDLNVDFSKIENVEIKEIVKRYFTIMLSKWKPYTFRWALGKMLHFFDAMFKLFPNINSFNELMREIHMERIISAMDCSNDTKKECLTLIRSMFKFMQENRWKDSPRSEGLIISYDIPKGNLTLPRPIPPDIKIHIDNYIDETIIPLLEQGKETPIIESKYWDLIIIIRYTGRRFEDIAHLISDGSDIDCLRYDGDGDPQLYLDHRIAKIAKDLVIPLAHLNKLTPYGNIVERAIKRQKQRVVDLPPVTDGYRYLFRSVKTDCRGLGEDRVILDSHGNEVIETISYTKFRKAILKKVCKAIPLMNQDNSVYTVTPHQFRHTVATEMIDAGIDIYAVKEFLGHSSISMTEQYIKVYQQRLKKEFKQKLEISSASSMIRNSSYEEQLYEGKWVKNKIIGVFELGDGCCEHLYKMPSCPHMSCKTCIKKKIYPRHLQAVKDTIESATVHMENAIMLGLHEKAEEFDKVVKFYKAALDKISSNEVFDASRDFYK